MEFSNVYDHVQDQYRMDVFNNCKSKLIEKCRDLSIVNVGVIVIYSGINDIS